ncbi:AraJ Arabinose efflux permease [Pyrenophora tritici-repentis]|uniref:AraJ, Arabinose efflux permease n=2 Tax=Pyrenophora tritici-repentis TaxID=45151 RepID=A0A2W1EAZ5_9PLEO|nr:lactose permease [Pyrenophora tritici-repentis Pt-1C-BFP]KAF7574931.1 AraJ, Arabinose efflux permease [Pyrenophora tritici-repentis]EDU45489.1 lactose permease [Pyrenophora tritici-repentis Pt-1C-BFP]KAI0589914.1 Lactose permease [Pyrenophora tritici-repentis]KAI0592367.1 Lactose permease [Pyrenophora tritici-repentis]KAI0615405.1 Lactose permease [Pyrenophora tritici-repentis]
MEEAKDNMNPVTQQISTADDDMHKQRHVVKETNVASVALAAAMEAEKPKLLSKGMIQLYMIMGIGYLVSTLNGFDSSLMGSINAMKGYQNTFGLTGAGSSTGIIFIIYNLGQIAAFPVCGFLADGYGRRICIFVGCALVIVGTAIQATAHETGHFIGGRFVLGFGASIASAAGPAYTVELAHPAYRGLMAGMYNNFWWLGNILAGWTTYGTNLHMGNSSWAWRIPTIVQCILPTIVMSLIMFFPETPRWLLAHDRREEAIAIMAKYHGNGNPDSPIVQLQLHEITEDFALSRDDNPWWDFRELANTRAARYRLAMVIAMAFFGQWSGNNVVSYFMPSMIKNAGITDPNKQLLINAINPIFSMLAAIYGATILDRVGRRKMLMGGLWGGLFAYVLLTAFTATANSGNNLAYGTIVSIYLFGIFFAGGWTPLQTLYSVECLENRTRAKGSGLNFLFLNVAMMVNTYGISVGIEKIGWKLYLVYIGWICVEITVIFFFFVETSGKTLEELKEIFEAPNPAKASLRKSRVAIDETGQIHSVED